MKNSHFFLIILLSLFTINLYSQNTKVEGYVFESDDRGYLNLVNIAFYKNGSDTPIETTSSNKEGYFEAMLPTGESFEMKANKELFFEHEQSVNTSSAEPTIYLKVKMEREPGYILDVTMAQKKDSMDEEVDAIVGSRIDIYNNTQNIEELVLEDHGFVNFQYTLKKGNHYTILIRKEGYLAKRIEAYVNVNGCIVCIDGVGSLTPGVSDNLTQGFEMGTLLANVELDKINFNKVYTLNNIYYDLNKATLKREAETELNNLITILNDNPSISIELGSHTDARGKDKYNYRLSQKRAESASNYLFNSGNIRPDRVIAKGYGETQLTNDCGNDVDCSEEDHQKNRRTEFKVLDKTAEVGYVSLKEMKRLSNMDKLLNEVQSQEVVEFKPGDEMPEDLKRQLAKEAAEKAKLESENNKKQLDEKQMDLDLKVKNIEKDIEAQKVEKGKMPLGNGGEKVEVSSAEGEKDLTIRSISEESFSGFLIKVYVAKEELNATSPELIGMKDIWVQEISEDLYYYYLGTFENLDSAKSVHKQLKENCPVCSIVKFEEGIIRP